MEQIEREQGTVETITELAQWSGLRGKNRCTGANSRNTGCTGTSWDGKTSELNSVTSAHKHLNEIYSDRVRWARSKKRESGHLFVTDTDNHAEGFHSKLNRATRESMSRTRLEKSMTQIQERMKTARRTVFLNASRAMRKLLDRTKIGSTNGGCYMQSSCTCGMGQKYRAIYVSDFSCMCNILLAKDPDISCARWWDMDDQGRSDVVIVNEEET